MDAVTQVPAPVNEPVLDYAPGSSRAGRARGGAGALGAGEVDLPHVIAGERVMGGGDAIAVRQPHAHAQVLGTMRSATTADAARAVAAAKEAAPGWRALSFDDRAAILLKAAELLSGPWRAALNAATMLGQCKTGYQAEIDSACELIDFWRINVHFARQILGEQPPLNSKGIWNRTDYRPLEGFVYAITPFNFTAIAGNLPTAPALMGNTVVWKPSPTQNLAAQVTMELLEAAGLPPGVINLVTGDGLNVSKVALADPDLAGIHFTGSTPTFQHLWREVGANLTGYRTYPRLVGETGGKDFILAHPSADPDVLRTAMIRGAFEYQGQKCSAASRAYVPASLWKLIRDDLVDHHRALTQGDVTDLSNFMGAVIDERSFAKNKAPSTAPRRHRRHRGRSPAARTTTGRLLHPPDRARVRRRDRRVVPHRVLRADPLGARLRRRPATTRCWTRWSRSRPTRLTGSIIAQDRAAIAAAHRAAAVRRRQLLHQRQADRRRRRAAALRWRARLGDQRQGRRRSEPAALDQRPLDQGDLRPADRPRLPPHGLRWAPRIDRAPAREARRGSLAQPPNAWAEVSLPVTVRWERAQRHTESGRMPLGRPACGRGPARWPGGRLRSGALGEPTPSGLVLAADPPEEGRGCGPLDLAAEQGDGALRSPSMTICVAAPSGRSRHGAAHRHGCAGGLDREGSPSREPSVAAPPTS